MKALNYILLCPMQCSMNGVVIDEHHSFMAPIFSMTMHTKLIMRNFDESHPIIIPLKTTKVTICIHVRKLIQEEYKDQSNIKIDCFLLVQVWYA